MSKKKKQMSIKEIVNDILENISDTTKETLSKAEPDIFGSYSTQYHFTLGTWIRNKYNLWEYGDADNMSSVIINKLVEKLKNKNI